MPVKPPIRVGVVAYLNMLPLIHGMEGLSIEGQGIQVVSIPPAPMVELMDRGELDVGMLPVGAVIGRTDLEIVGYSMIGADGPVKSVLALGGGAPGTWDRLHPDSHSRSSNLLARVILAGCYDRRPRIADPIPLNGWSPPDEPAPGEAYVLIGTRALHWRRHWHERPDEDATVLDLGDAWKSWTGLPFVFAVWAARKGAGLGSWMEKFEELKRRNQANLGSIVRSMPGLEEEQLTPDEARLYLTENIRYDLDDRALAGLERFYEEGRRLKLFPAGWRIENAVNR